MIKRLLSSILLVIVVAASMPSMALAWDPFGNIDCSSASASAVCNDKSNQRAISGTNGIIITVVDVISFIAGISAVILLIVAGIRFVVSGGDANSVQQARSSVIGVLVGIAIIVLARSLIVYVVNRL